MDAFTHYIRPGRTSEGSIYIRIHWDGMRLSITGSEGRHHGGQITDVLHSQMTYAEGWDSTRCAELAAVWDRWHLNDMRAGTQRQMAHLRLYPKDAYSETHPGNWYGWACSELDAVGLLADAGYRFGTAWLREAVPEEVLKYLYNLPRVAAEAVPGWAR